MRKRNKMSATVLSFEGGYVLLEDLRAIRIKSKEYNIMIMEDYMPVIGEVNGDVTFMGDDFREDYNGIQGFYVHKNNKFQLLLKGKDDV